jgi:hypothetical protein
MPAFSLDVIHLSLARGPSPEAMELPVEVCRARDVKACTHSVQQQQRQQQQQQQQRGGMYVVVNCVDALCD